MVPLLVNDNGTSWNAVYNVQCFGQRVEWNHIRMGFDLIFSFIVWLTPLSVFSSSFHVLPVGNLQFWCTTIDHKSLVYPHYFYLRRICSNFHLRDSVSHLSGSNSLLQSKGVKSCLCPMTVTVTLHIYLLPHTCIMQLSPSLQVGEHETI